LALVNFAGLVDELAPAGAFSIEPISYIVISVGVNEPSISIVDIVLELPLVDDVVDLFAHTGHLSVNTELSNDILVVVALSEGQGLIDWLSRVGYNFLQLEWAKLVPLVLGGLQSDAM
jgi:hypothetical protein